MKKRLEFGWAQTDITPSRPAPLAGQFHTRISKGVLDPLTATALAVRAEDDSEQVILASIDAVWVADATRDRVRALLAKTLPGFDPRNLVIGATHTHTAPSQMSRYFDYPVFGAPGILSQEDYTEFLAQKLAAICAQAWAAKRPGAFAYGRAPAVVGHNRRTAYFNGDSAMYGPTGRDDFSHMEGYEDHFLNALFTYDASNALTGMILNVPCPSQVSENSDLISADYWHEVRRDIGDRIAAAFAEVFDWAKKDIRTAMPIRHRVETVRLSKRLISKAEYEHAKAELAKLEQRPFQTDGDPIARLNANSSLVAGRNRYRRILARYKTQEAEPKLPMELHVLRIGDIAFASNRFELFMDFQHRIQARSPFEQTFIVQLAGTPGPDGGTYLATERGAWGCGYSASMYCNVVSPQGGQELVEETVKALFALHAEGSPLDVLPLTPAP